MRDILYETVCAHAHKEFPGSMALIGHSMGDTEGPNTALATFRVRKQLRMMMAFLVETMQVNPDHFTHVRDIRRIPHVTALARAKRALHRFQDIYDAERREGGADSAAKYLAGSLLASLLLNAYDHRKVLDLEQAAYLFFCALDGKGSKDGIGQLLNEMRDTR